MAPVRHPLGVRLRWWRHRHPLVCWSVSIAVIWVGAPGLDRVGPQSAATRPVPVFAARSELAVGTEIAAADLRSLRVDATTVAGDPSDDPVGRTVTRPILAGEVVVDERLAPAGLSGPAALVPAGWLAVAVPTTLAAPPARLGDRVDVFGVDPTRLEPTTHRLARAALVVAVDDDAITVATEPDAAGAIAGALGAGVVTLALHGP